MMRYKEIKRRGSFSFCDLAATLISCLNNLMGNAKMNKKKKKMMVVIDDDDTTDDEAN